LILYVSCSCEYRGRTTTDVPKFPQKHSCSVRIKCNRLGKTTRILTYFIMWTNFTFFGRNFYVLLINYQPRMAEILTVIFMLNC